jgi:DNA-binding Xre family transcriptional regulator
MSNIIEYIPDNYKKKSDSIDIAKIDRYNKYVYGVNLRLDPIMKLRGFRRKTTFLKETDISMSRQTLYEILGKQNIDSKLLRGFILLCEKLNCKLSDIIDYTPTPKRDLPEITLSKIRS